MQIKERIKTNIELRNITSFKIGGSAKFYVEITDKQALFDTLNWAKENNEKIFILGGGSNILVNDRGVNGLVVKIQNDSLQTFNSRIVADSGVSLGKVVNAALDHGLSGLEWATGIPGSFGGAIRGNAGAFGRSLAESIEVVNVFDLKRQRFIEMSNEDCRFVYRDSIFKDHDNHIIWSAAIKLNTSERDVIKDKMNDNLSQRLKNNPHEPSAGCIFKNLDLDYVKDINADLADDAREKNTLRGNKISAGWIIEKLDLKGKQIGGAKVSDEHANFIINTGKATSEDVAMLISFIKQQARTKYGIQLQEEIVYFGF